MQMGWDTSDWNDLFRRFGIVSSLWHAFKRLYNRAIGTDVEVIEFNDYNDDLTSWSFSGVNLGVNTSADGKLYVSFSFNGVDTYTVSVYSDSARSNLVAQGSTTSSPPTSLALSEQNDSGLSGSVYISQYTADNDKIYLVLLQGLHAQIDNLPEADQADTDYKNDLRDLADDIAADLDRILSRIERFANNQMITLIARKLQTSETSAGGYTTEDTDGVISEERTGVLGDLADAMEDESTAQSIKECSPTSSVDTDADNQGKGTLSITLHDYALEGRITLKCNDDTIGSETFAVAHRSDDEGVVTAANDLTIKKSYADPATGIASATLSRTIEDSGDEADHFSDWSFSGESSSNTDNGVIYFKYTKESDGTPVRKLEGFKSSTRTEAYKVCEGTWDGDPSHSLDFHEYNGSGLSGSVKVSLIGGEEPETTSSLVVDLNVFAEDDVIVVDVTEDTSGKFMTFFGRVFDFELPASASPTIEDGLADKGVAL